MALASISLQNQTVLESLEEGDLVEFPGLLYSHWAVYVGKGDVVHLTGDPNAPSSVNSNPSHVFSICGKLFDKAVVRRDKFTAVAADFKAQKNNSKDMKVSPSDRQTIVQRALSKIGEIGYNILWQNCECFASWCRYGKAWSEQTINLLKGLGLLVVGVAVGGAFVGAIVGAIVGALSGSKDKKK